jgi:hypothetical protein
LETRFGRLIFPARLFIRKIQAFENAQPNPNLKNSDFISEYEEYDTQTTEYFLSNNWNWPSGVTYSDGTVVYKEPIKMVFPVGDVFSTYHLELFYYEGQQIGSNVWWLIGYKDKPIVHIRPVTVELRNAFDDFFNDKSFYGYDDNYNSGEMIALRGISFRDENNLLRFFSISKDGTSVYHLKEIPIKAFG